MDHAAQTIRRLAVVAAVTTLISAPALTASAHDGTGHGAGHASSVSGAAVIEWNARAAEAALACALAPANNPLHESRMYAMMHLAIHDSLNAIKGRAEPYAYRARAKGAAPLAAIAAAARGTLVAAVSTLPEPFSACAATEVPAIEASYAAALAEVPDGAAKNRGVALGTAAAQAIVALRTGDGSDTPLFDTAYPQGTEPGEYRFTSPDLPFAFAPGWGDVTPFALRSARQFRSDEPYPLESRAYARDFNEVKALGGDGTTTPSARTADQTEVARFWVESSPLLWNRLARSLAEQRGLDAWQAARLFGLLDMALADGYIGTFDQKYDQNFWRPVTAIREAGSDGNPRTSPDPTWTPLVTTPPIPDHDSGHAVEGGAAAAVLRGFFGSDRAHFTLCSHTLPPGQTCTDPDPVMRSFHRFSQAASENADSRVLVGFHFRHASTSGTEHGTKIGRYVVRRYLELTHH
ncbi:vanadium-dependent haloperoxidase [Knoellia aerolata]|uniref:Phosphoesterase PA-phosphatase n=1 Tax=Knoellia aerolata DSM 18566 TaxID=1385519 RepID=A0A0A0K1D0_9MICO|nr:vanadium-dependent haloperoxidase [Knoellia aerolata]KGN42809.1 phosphoesterase PA-phosphatase [Knoellia aerolata DSM 18566]